MISVDVNTPWELVADVNIIDQRSATTELLCIYWQIGLCVCYFFISCCVLAASEREPYEAEAKLDQERYKRAMAGYKSGAGQPGPDAGSDDEGSDEE